MPIGIVIPPKASTLAETSQILRASSNENYEDIKELVCIRKQCIYDYHDPEKKKPVPKSLLH